MEKEIIWKEIPGFNGKYFISNAGDVKSCFFGKEKIMSAGLNRGYKVLGLSAENKTRINFRVHRLVASIFVENDDPINKTEVHHIDGNPLNNNVENLEWCNHISNCQKDYINGRRNNQKNTSESVKKIRELHSTGQYTRNELCVMFNLSKSVICDIINRRKWGYID